MPASRLWADLSNNNPSLSHALYAKDHVLLGYKATEGGTFKDSTHAHNVSQIHKHRVAVAHYHFAKPNSGHGPKEQARFFWQTVKPYFKNGDYLVLDLEEMKSSGRVGTIEWAVAFKKELYRISKHRPILYTSLNYLQIFGPRIRFHFPRIWMAQYAEVATPPSWAKPLWAWQRTGDGIGRKPHSLPGCPAPCDVNILNNASWRHLRRVLKRK